jgi:hypothetical protein
MSRFAVTPYRAGRATRHTLIGGWWVSAWVGVYWTATTGNTLGVMLALAVIGLPVLRTPDLTPDTSGEDTGENGRTDQPPTVQEDTVTITAEYVARPARFDQCTGSCTADCGHCKGAPHPTALGPLTDACARIDAALFDWPEGLTIENAARRGQVTRPQARAVLTSLAAHGYARVQGDRWFTA